MTGFPLWKKPRPPGKGGRPKGDTLAEPVNGHDSPERGRLFAATIAEEAHQ